MRAIDADRLIDIFSNLSEYDKYTAVFVDQIIKIINEQPTVATGNEQSEIVITAKAWDELPVDIKARMITNLKSALTITGYAQS